MKGDTKKTILLVEDEVITAMAEKMTLEKFGYRVQVARSGEEAIAAAGAAPGIDLILMDINLGAGIDGTEAAAVILQTRDLPVVFLSSHTEPEIVKKTERITSYGYVVKDSSGTVLDASIKMAFKLFASKIKEMEKEDALRESEEWNRLILGTILSGVIVVDAGTREIVDVNSTALAMIGLAKEQVVGSRCHRFVCPAQESNCPVLDLGKEVDLSEKTLMVADGRRKPIIKTVVPITRNGRKYLIESFVDISERKQAEQLPETLYKISQTVYTTDNLDKLFEHVHHALAGIIPTDNLFIALLSDDGQVLTFPYSRDEKDTGAAPIIEVTNERSLTVEVLKTKRSLLLNEAELRDRYATGRNKVWGSAPKCWLGVPLIIKEKVIGVMAVQDYHHGDAYGRKDVALLESTAGQIAIAIDRKRAEKALRESEESFKGYFNMGTVGMCVTSPEKGWIEVNDRLCGMLGYTREELVRLTWDEMTHADDLHADLDLFNQVLAGERDSYQLEKRFIRKDGQVLHALLYVTCQRHADGRVYLLLASLVDISERKRAEEALAQERFLMQALMDNVPDYVYFKDRDSRFIRINPAHARSFALGDPAQAVGRSDFDFFTAEHARQAFEDEQAIMRTGQPLSKEERETRPGRPDTWVMTTKMPLRDAGGNLSGTFGISRDITGRKQAEEEIKRQLAEKEILLKEVHHRIKNNIATVGGLISLRLKSIRNPEAVAALQDAIGRVDSMRILYDKLLLGDEYEDLSVKNYIESLIDTIIALFPDSIKITVEKRIADFQLVAKRLFPLGLIINELLTNKIKYAFASRESGRIGIILENHAGRATLSIEDDGDTLPAGFDIERSKGFGLTLVKMLSQQLGGRFAMEGKAGTRCLVEFDV